MKMARKTEDDETENNSYLMTLHYEDDDNLSEVPLPLEPVSCQLQTSIYFPEESARDNNLNLKTVLVQ